MNRHGDDTIGFSVRFENVSIWWDRLEGVLAGSLSHLVMVQFCVSEAPAGLYLSPGALLQAPSEKAHPASMLGGRISSSG